MLWIHFAFRLPANLPRFLAPIRFPSRRAAALAGYVAAGEFDSSTIISISGKILTRCFMVLAEVRQSLWWVASFL